MAMLKTRKIILALIHQLPKMMNDQMLSEVQGLYRKLEIYNIIMINHMRKVGI